MATDRDEVERVARRLEVTPLYEGSGEESELPEQGADMLRALAAENASLREKLEAAEAMLADAYGAPVEADDLFKQRLDHALEAALREKLEAVEADTEAADHALVDRYRNPKTGIFKFPDDVAAIIRALADDWTRWKLGESIDVLAKERGCTRERMRYRLNRLDKGRTVLALQAQLDEARKALALMDHWGVIIRDDDGKHMSVPLRHYQSLCRALAATTATPSGAAG